MPKKKSMDLTKPVRQQKIYNILRMITSEEDALPVREIHKQLEDEGVKTCPRTITRDLDEMSSTHHLNGTETFPAKFYSSGIKPEYQMTFSESEIQTMIMALQGLKTKSSPYMKELCAKTETILLSKLHKEDARDFENFKAYTMVTPAFRGESTCENSDSFRLIMKSLKSGKVIECENHSPYSDDKFNKAKRKFSVLFINMVGGENYLWVHDHKDLQLKQVKICRIHNVSILDEKIDQTLRKKLTNLENCIGGFGGPGQPVLEYSITCDKVMAALFRERKIHSSQEIIEHGGIHEIKFKCNPSVEILRYISGWAKNIYSIEPESFRNDLEEIWEAGSRKNLKGKAAA